MTRQKQLTAGTKGEQLSPIELQRLEMDGFINLVREAATNPNVDPEKLGKLLDLRERVMDRGARQAFNEAMRLAQQEMRSVARDAKNPDKGNRYATFKALDKHIRPIYTKHGFSVTFDTGIGNLEKYGPILEGHIRILMDIAHSGGHEIQKHTDVFLETTGAQGKTMMTRIHAGGSAMSYGKRYLLIFGFNLAVGENDDDGNRASGDGEKARDKGKGPQSKADRKQTGKQQGNGREAAQKAFPTITKATKDGDRIQKSSVQTMLANMKRSGVSEDDFVTDFGFPVAETDKHGLNEIIDWMKEKANA